MENVVHKGYMHCLVIGILQKKQWQKRFYVLYGSTRANQSRLDFYEDEKAYEKDPKFRKSCFMENIKDIQERADIVKGRSHIIEISLLDTKKDITLSCDSKAEVEDWMVYLRSVKQGGHRLSVPNSSTPSSRTSSRSSDVTVFDDNVLYEEAELCSFFDVEVATTDSAKQCKLEGRYVLVVSVRSLDLRDYEGTTLYSWPYKNIRRYGRSSSSFTFEAGRKCTSGAGLFTFLTEQGDTVFLTVQKQTRSLRGDTHSVGSIEEEPVAPALPKRNYSGYGTRDSGGDSPVFTDDARPSSGESNGKVTTKGPPMMKPKPKRIAVGAALEEYAEINKGQARKAQGKSAVQYDLAKVTGPTGPDDDDDHLYTEPYEPTTLNANYRTAARPPAENEDDLPDYALYDITQSSRFQGNGDDDDDVDGNVYEIPEEVTRSGSKDLSDICANLRKASVEPSGEDQEEYYTLELAKGPVKPSQLRLAARNDYSDIDGDTLAKKQAARQSPPPVENFYDEVYPNG